MAAATEIADRSLIRALNSKGTGTVAIFDKGEYYACYRDDAVFLANEIFRSDVCLKSITLTDDTSLHYLTLNSGQYQRVVRELLMLLRYRVELYGLDEGKWTIKAKGTIGNVGDFEDIVGDVINCSSIMAIKLAAGEDQRVSVCFWDTAELRLTTTEFLDSSLFSHVEQCIIGMNPRECVVIGQPAGASTTERRKKLAALLKRLQVLDTPYTQSTSACSFDDVKALLRNEAVAQADELSESIRSVLCALLDYLKMEDGFAGKFSLSDYRTSGYMHIDAAAVRALELFNLSYFQDSGSSGTLFGILNKCKTASGQRLLRDWIARPLCDIRLLTERQSAVTALLRAAEQRRTLADALLPRVPDTAQLTRKLLQGKAKLQDCYRIYQLIVLLHRFETTVRQIFDDESDLEHGESAAPAVKELMLEPLCYAVAQFDRFAQLIRGTVDADHFEKTGSYRVKPDIDPQLLDIAEQMDEIEKKCERARSKISGSLDLDSIKLDSNAQYGFFYRVPLKDEKAIRQCECITVLDTSKGAGTRFVDDSLASLNEKYQELNAVYQTSQLELEQKVVETCAGYTSSLSQLTATLSSIDVLVSLATVAGDSAHGYVRPQLEPMGSGVFDIKQCRHPVLETVMDNQFIPNDVSLGEGNRLIVLTGANMGGKSTYLRSAALCALMAQIGSYVPAASARLSLLDGLFTRVGASDQQTRGISTFMAEMLGSAAILETATSNSLVIVDELGRGTSTFDGFGLAWAIASDLLTRVGCFCLFATHFHEMAELAEQEGAVAMQTCVCLEGGQLSMLYSIRPGVAHGSFGIHVAKMVGFPEKVIEEASTTLSRMQEGADDVIARLKAADGDHLRQMLLAL